MLTRMVAVLACVTLALPVALQAQSNAVQGTVTGTDVYVRCSPGQTGSYPVTKVSSPTKVTVVGQRDEWLKILPVKGCYSVIAKQYVKPDATGKAGVVTGDNVWVRAAGDLCTWTKVADYWQLHRRMPRGSKVEIVGQSGDFYKITPPAGSHYWIFAKYVDMGGKTAAQVDPSLGSGSVRLVPDRTATTQRTRIVAVAPTTAHDEPVDTSTARGQFQAVKKEMKAEYAKPIDQRDLNGIIAKFKAIDTTGDSNLRKLVDYYVKYLNAQLEQYGEAKQIQDQVARTKEAVSKQQAEADKMTIDINTAQVPTYYPADGVLAPSGLFPGDKATPKRWKVTDPDTRRITAYVQSTTGSVDLEQYVGKHVGVKGASHYDKDLGLYIVEAETVKIMGEKEVVPPSPQPEVKAVPEVDEYGEPVETPKAPLVANIAASEPASPPATEPAATMPATEPAVDEEPATDDRPSMGDDQAAEDDAATLPDEPLPPTGLESAE